MNGIANNNNNDIYNHDFIGLNELNIMTTSPVDPVPDPDQDDEPDNNLNTDNNAHDAPIHCLRPTTLNMLSTMLNPIKILPTDSGLARDWRGLAELIGLTSDTITYLQSRSDPTAELIKIWSSSSSSSLSNSTMIGSKNIAELLTFLSVIDRFDIVVDTEPFIEKDITFYKSRLLHHSISSSDYNRTVPELDSINENELLTYDDQLLGRAGKLTRYDAFLLCSEDDTSFAMEIVDKMENNYNLKMCLKERDLIPGVMFEHEVIGKLIEQRCNRLLVIFSPSFLESPANQFLVSYTSALALELRQRKIIPCIYKHCTLPPSVRYSFCLDFNRSSSSKLWNFWDKLSQSLSANVASSSSSSSMSSPSRSISNNSSQSQKSFESSSPLALTTTTNKYGASLPNDISWWDAKKSPSSPPPHSFQLSTSYSHSDSGYSQTSTNISESDDNLSSIHSQAPLLRSSSHESSNNSHNHEISSSSTTKPKSKKWIKKFLNPMKKKHSKDKSGAGEAQAVEVLES